MTKLSVGEIGHLVKVRVNRTGPEYLIYRKNSETYQGASSHFPRSYNHPKGPTKEDIIKP